MFWAGGTNDAVIRAWVSDTARAWRMSPAWSSQGRSRPPSAEARAARRPGPQRRGARGPDAGAESVGVDEVGPGEGAGEDPRRLAVEQPELVGDRPRRL